MMASSIANALDIESVCDSSNRPIFFFQTSTDPLSIAIGTDCVVEEWWWDIGEI